MGVDALARRYHVILFGGMVAMAAYFQADGVGQLVAARLVPEKPVSSRAKTGPVETNIQTRKSANEILARNPFDSETGSLLATKNIAADDTDLPDTPAPVAAPGIDPYKDPPCPGIGASLITATEDPAWSFASISSSQGTKLRRIGDVIGNYKVHHIGFLTSPEPLPPTPSVWLSEGPSRCIVALGAAEVPAARPQTIAADPPAKTKKQKQAEELSNKVKSKIRKVGENQYEVDKSGVEMIIQNYAQIAGRVSARSTKDGMKVSGIKAGSVLGEIGMKNGDRLQTINGFDMTDPDKAVDAYAKLRSAGKLSISAVREGAPYTIDIQIK